MEYLQKKMGKPSYTKDDYLVSKGIIEKARELRQEETKAEDFLWTVLRNRKVNNYKFRRQHPLPDGYILDFFCAQTKVGIELDGEVHKYERQKGYDDARQKEIFAKYGIRILRFWNGEVLEYPEKVIDRIIKFSRSND